MTIHAMLPENPLQPHGATIKEYRGTGQLTLSSKRRLTCEFAAGQLEDGKTILLCATQDFFVASLASRRQICSKAPADGDEIFIDRVASLMLLNRLTRDLERYPERWINMINETLALLSCGDAS